MDNGISSAISVKDIHTERRYQIDYKPMQDVNIKQPSVFTRVKSRVLEIVNDHAANKPTPRTLVIDSLTTLGEASLRSVLYSGGHLDVQPQIQEWGLAMGELDKLLLWVRSLTKITVILIAHQEMKAVDDKNQAIELWCIGNKLAPKIPAFFDEIWYSRTKDLGGGKTGYEILTKPTGIVKVARSRGNLPECVDMNLGMPKILEMAGYPV